MSLRLPAKRQHKYRAKPTHLDGVRFASKAEANRYGELKMLENAGEIHTLLLQPEFTLAAPSPHRGEPPFMIGQYRGDFFYCKCSHRETCQRTHAIVEDVKGYDTPLSKWKRKHVEAQYGITVQIVRKGSRR